MTPCDLRKELEKRMLINPIVTEAVDMIGRGVSENHAFCWSSLKLVEENESLKEYVASLQRNRKVLTELKDVQSTAIEEYKALLDLIKARNLVLEAKLLANKIDPHS